MGCVPSKAAADAPSRPRGGALAKSPPRPEAGTPSPTSVLELRLDSKDEASEDVESVAAEERVEEVSGGGAAAPSSPSRGVDGGRTRREKLIHAYFEEGGTPPGPDFLGAPRAVASVAAELGAAQQPALSAEPLQGGDPANEDAARTLWPDSGSAADAPGRDVPSTAAAAADAQRAARPSSDAPSTALEAPAELLKHVVKRLVQARWGGRGLRRGVPRPNATLICAAFVSPLSYFSVSFRRQDYTSFIFCSTGRAAPRRSGP